jgi:hypothetical protein
MPFVSPVGGLNARDALANMPANDAITMDNVFPTTDGVETRLGSTEHATGLGAPVKSLATYNGSAGRKLLGFANGKIFDCTATGAATELASGRVSDEVQSNMFVNAGNYWLIMVNGQDSPVSYDGVAIADLNITGVTGGETVLFQVFAFKGRLYFAANNQAGFYYLPVGNIQGAASYFDLGQVAQHGGNLAAICSITRDGGDGPDDLMVFIMDTGEYIVYAGFDPSAAANWELVGRFYVAPPIGKKPIVKLGGDTVLLTQLGMVSLSRIFDGQEFNPEADTISYKLGSALDAHMTFINTFGWQAVVHSFGSKLILNVPFSSTLGTYYQYVMNTKTNAWCRFVGWDGISWAVVGNALYFGHSNGKVYQADTGFSDNGTDIRCDVRQAYSRFDELLIKHFHSARLIVSYETVAPSISVGFGVDFKDAAPNYASASLTTADSLWDIATWDVSSWGAEGEVTYFEADLDKLGFAGSLWWRAVANGSQIRWFATEYLYEKGGLIGG